MEFIFSHPASPCGWRPDKCRAVESPYARCNLAMSSEYIFCSRCDFLGLDWLIISTWCLINVFLFYFIEIKKDKCINKQEISCYSNNNIERHNEVKTDKMAASGESAPSWPGAAAASSSAL